MKKGSARTGQVEHTRIPSTSKWKATDEMASVRERKRRCLRTPIGQQLAHQWNFKAKRTASCLLECQQLVLEDGVCLYLANEILQGKFKSPVHRLHGNLLILMVVNQFPLGWERHLGRPCMKKKVFILRKYI